MLIPNEVDDRLLAWLRDCLVRGAEGRRVIAEWVQSGEPWEERAVRRDRLMPLAEALNEGQ